jgi:hypothetical protein
MVLTRDEIMLTISPPAVLPHLRRKSAFSLCCRKGGVEVAKKIIRNVERF